MLGDGRRMAAPKRELRIIQPSRAPNPFLRSWVWKREHRPDRDRFDRPYIHELAVKGEKLTLVIGQARFHSKGFASTVWDSAIVLSKYLERWPHLVAGKQCIELGAGCGLPGIVTAYLGASSVLLTDFPENLPLLEENVSSNGISNRVSVVSLEWGSQCHASTSPFDVVLATDIMYSISAIDPLLRTLQRISGLQSTIFLAYGRNRQAEEEFMRVAGNLFSMERVAEEELDEVYQCVDVDVFMLRPIK